jgi:hypothetical protein
MTGKRRPAKETLDTPTSEIVVLVRTVRGGGGEGRLEAGLQLGQLTSEPGDATLTGLGSLPTHADLVAIATRCALTGCANPTHLLHDKRAIQPLAANMGANVAGEHVPSYVHPYHVFAIGR